MGKRVLQAIAVSLAAGLLAFALAGCTSSTSSASTSASTSAASASASAASASASAASASSAAFTPYTITDMGGREVTIEKPIEKAYATNLIGVLYIETMDIDKLGGFTNKLSDDEKKYLPEKYWDLPYLGGWSSANPSANIEEVVNAGIDVILVTAPPNEKMVQQANNITSQTGIPTIMVSSNLKDLPAAYELLGKVFQNEERGNKLSAYCKNELDEVSGLVAKVPADKVPSVYYAESATGLETDPSGSMHTQVFDFLGLKNVAEIAENTSNGLVGQSAVSIEQVIAWNPDFIVVNCTYSQGGETSVLVPEMRTSADWAGIKAIQDKHVYGTPYLPNNWIDRGPSVNRILGMKWLANLVYPDTFSYDIHAEAKEFFSTFYGRDLTDAQLDEILLYSSAY